MTTTEERQSPTAGQRAAKAGAKHLGRKIGWILGAKIGFWVAVVLVLLLLPLGGPQALLPTVLDLIASPLVRLVTGG